MPKVEQFAFHSRFYEITHYFTLIDKIPFYCSADRNKEIFLPFYSVDERTEKYNTDFNLPANIPESILKELRKSPFAQLGDPKTQFINIYCLLISCVLSGELWNTSEGKRLGKVLEKEYPFFFKKITPCVYLKVDPQKGSFSNRSANNLARLNLLLCSKIGITDPLELKSCVTKNIQDLSEELELLHIDIENSYKKLLPAYNLKLQVKNDVKPNLQPKPFQKSQSWSP